VLTSLEQGTAEERLNGRMSCTIKYQIVIQLGALLVNSVLFPDIRYQISSSCSIFLILKCVINLVYTLVHNLNSALPKLEKFILNSKLFLRNTGDFAGRPVKTKHLLVSTGGILPVSLRWAGSRTLGKRGCLLVIFEVIA
jgi:hypothetical protein